MTLLFLDIESSGLFKRHLPVEHPEQPWCVSLAAELCNDAGEQLASINTGIRANGRKISAGAAEVHGISSERAARTGISELAALAVLCGKESLASQAQAVIGHGISFDCDVIASLLARHGREPAAWMRPGLTFIDTMKAATPFCQIKSEHENGGFKWPTLDEACSALIGEEPRNGHHGAWDDVQRAKRLFFALRNRNAFDLPAEAA